jgi:CheY-like chemotaxis protein
LASKYYSPLQKPVFYPYSFKYCSSRYYFYATLKKNAMTGLYPIVIVDDDIDDQEILETVFEELNITHERLYFSSCYKALDFLKTGNIQPFIIICDVNLPALGGLDFKKLVDSDEELKRKNIPFVFMSTAADSNSVTRAYTEITIQGFFKKENSITELKRTLSVIVDYWTLCTHPNSIARFN